MGSAVPQHKALLLPTICSERQHTQNTRGFGFLLIVLHSLSPAALQLGGMVLLLRDNVASPEATRKEFFLANDIL